MGPRRPIYLDYHATTPVDPRVLGAMLPYFSEIFGNPASKNHSFGNEAFKAVEEARETVAKAIKARAQEIVFTSGATEAINLAIKGAAVANRERGKHFITVATEHKAVLDCFEWLKGNAFETTVLPVDSMGLVDPLEVAKAIRGDTVLVSVMAANNEIGVLQPIGEIGAVCRAKGVFFMTDATQALGKVPLDVQRQSIDLLAASGHKIYGPKGIGFLYARRSNPRVALEPIIHGGGHERGFRSGTLPTQNIVGLGSALAISLKEMAGEQRRIGGLRDVFLKRLAGGVPGLRVNGAMDRRLAGNLNVVFPDIESEAFMIALKNDVAVSSGSACTTAAVLPSHVLKALGLSDRDTHSSIRIGIGRSTTEDEVSLAAQRMVEEWQRLRAWGVGAGA